MAERLTDSDSSIDVAAVDITESEYYYVSGLENEHEEEEIDIVGDNMEENESLSSSLPDRDNQNNNHRGSVLGIFHNLGDDLDEDLETVDQPQMSFLSYEQERGSRDKKTRLPEEISTSKATISFVRNMQKDSVSLESRGQEESQIILSNDTKKSSNVSDAEQVLHEKSKESGNPKVHNLGDDLAQDLEPVEKPQMPFLSYEQECGSRLPEKISTSKVTITFVRNTQKYSGSLESRGQEESQSILSNDDTNVSDAKQVFRERSKESGNPKESQGKISTKSQISEPDPVDVTVFLDEEPDSNHTDNTKIRHNKKSDFPELQESPTNEPKNSLTDLNRDQEFHGEGKSKKIGKSDKNIHIFEIREVVTEDFSKTEARSSKSVNRKRKRRWPQKYIGNEWVDDALPEFQITAAQKPQKRKLKKDTKNTISDEEWNPRSLNRKHRKRVPRNHNSNDSANEDDSNKLGERRKRKSRQKKAENVLMDAKCPICDKEFSVLQRLEVHMRIHKSAPVYRCDNCKLFFKDSEELQYHECEAIAPCTICGKVFQTTAGRKQHKKTHTSERAYQCSMCDKAFHVKSSLCSHMVTHATIRPYQCEHCKKTFAKQYNLRLHARIHTEEKPFQCTICKKRFTQQSNLATHTRIHSNEQPHICQRCGKAFTHQSTLKSHMRSHTQEKPYACKLCTKTFSHRGSLKNHQLVHTKEKKFQCSQCEMKFAHRQSWAYHENLHKRYGKKLKPSLPRKIAVDVLLTKN